MQAAERAGGMRLESGMRVELPVPLRELARVVLEPLSELLASVAPQALPISPLLAGDASPARVELGAEGWWLQYGHRRERAGDAEEMLLRLQELEVEAAACRGQWLLFRSSVVTRGSQTLMIVSAHDRAHIRLAVALAALEFRPVSMGLAAFGSRAGRGCVAPLPLRLAFGLTAEEQELLESLSARSLRHLERLTPTLFRPAHALAAPEPTHILFPDPAPSTSVIVRPLSAPAARARLCGALTAAPDAPSPFEAVAALLRPARGIHLASADLSSSLEQLGRLLPQWSLG